MSAQHTPTPWSAEVGGGRGSWIKGYTGEWTALSCGDTDASAEANARFIVRAVNCHDELLAALEGDIDWIDALSQMTIERDTAMVRIRAHRALIAKARGTVPTLDKGDM